MGRMKFNPYEPPARLHADFESTPPSGPVPRGIWRAFVLYCWFMVLIYGACIGGGAILIFGPTFFTDDPEGQLGMGLILVAIGLVFAPAFGVAPFLRPGRRVWVYDLVLICGGLTSILTLPFAIPLLVYWCRDSTKTAFGRGQPTSKQ